MDAGDVELLRRMESDLQRELREVRAALDNHDHPHVHETPADPEQEAEPPALEEELDEPDVPESDVIPAEPADDDTEIAPVRVHPLHARLW